MDERPDLVRRIKDLLDIVDVVGSYVELSKRGNRYLALCPFHAEKDASFTVNSQEQFFHCFGCKKSGDVFDFVMAMEGVSFSEALEMLGERCGVRVERDPAGRGGSAGGWDRSRDKTRLLKVLESACSYYERTLQSAAGASARRYLAERQFPPDAFHAFRLGYATDAWRALIEHLAKQGFQAEEMQRAGLAMRGRTGSPFDLFRNRLMIPIFDMQGRVVGFGGRVLDGSEPKYINSPETEIFRKSRLLYGLNRARRAITEQRTAVVVEGYTDVLMAHHRGVTNAVATLGTALTHEHARALRRMADRVLLLFDGDSAGALAAKRGVEIVLSHGLDVAVVPLETGTDPCDFFRENDAGSFRRLAASGRDFFDFSLRNLAEQHDARTPGGRTRIAREMFRLAAVLEDPIKQDLILHRIAEALNIREDLLRREFLRSGEPAARVPAAAARTEEARRAARSPASTGAGRTAMAEEDLLVGLVKQPDLIERFRTDLEKLRLDSRALAAILALLLQPAPGGPPRLKDLLFSLAGDEEAKNRLIGLLSDARPTEADALVAASIEYLTGRGREQRYRQLRDKHREAPAGGETGGGQPDSGVLPKAAAGPDEALAELDRMLREKDARRRRDK